MSLTWSQKYELGHERIDFEHRIFVSLIAAVEDEFAGDNARPRLQRLLNEVLKYAEFHFVSEENMMEDVGYPDLAAHRDAHRALLSTLRDRANEFAGGRLEVPALVDFLFHWFALHTTQEDRKVVSFIAANRS